MSFLRFRRYILQQKRKIFVCEDCDETFSEHQLSTFQDKKQSKVGLDLFFSYGHDKNRVLVERIKQDLEKRGHRVWIDTSEIKGKVITIVRRSGI